MHTVSSLCKHNAYTKEIRRINKKYNGRPVNSLASM